MSAGSRGLGAWLVQRFSAVYLAFFVVYFAVSIAICKPGDFETWHHWIMTPAMNIAMSLFFIALAAHAWVGVRDVVIDYVHSTALRVGLLAIIGAALLACLLWAGRVLWVS